MRSKWRRIYRHRHRHRRGIVRKSCRGRTKEEFWSLTETESCYNPLLPRKHIILICFALISFKKWLFSILITSKQEQEYLLNKIKKIKKAKSRERNVKRAGFTLPQYTASLLGSP